MVTMMRKIQIVSLTALATALASCGGGTDGTIASALPPPPALSQASSTGSANVVSTTVQVAPIPSPGTRPATYDTIALIDHSGLQATPFSTSRVAAPSEVKITTYQSGPAANDVSYLVELPAGELPDGQTSLTAIFKPGSITGYPNGRYFQDQYGTSGSTVLPFGNAARIIDSYSDGSQKVTVELQNGQRASEEATESLRTGNLLWHQLVYNVQLSYVSLGEWAWMSNSVGPDGRPGPAVDAGMVYFVHGDRTPAADIPTTGTATYTGSSLGFDTDSHNWDFHGYGSPIQIALTADFARSAISANLNRDYAEFGDAIGGYLTTAGLDLHGTGTIASAGGFSIPLAGSLMFDKSTATPVTGGLDGAFYGPHAEQVGGVFAVGRAPGETLVRDAFVAAHN
jgi:hypothetical protein